MDKLMFWRKTQARKDTWEGHDATLDENSSEPIALQTVESTRSSKLKGPDLASFKTFVDSSLRKKKKICRSAKKSFLAQYSESYDDKAVEAFRNKEFSRLDNDKETYLDFVGGSLPPMTLIERSFASLQSGAAGNPHSAGKKSKQSLDKLREEVMKFFNCNDTDDYEMIVTANASGAITIVAECFPFERGSTFVLTKDNHTSVHSICEGLTQKGGSIRYVTLTSDLTISDTCMNGALNEADPSALNLLAYPAQSNATGMKHDLGWVAAAQRKGFLVLLDAAAYVPTTSLDLSSTSNCRPDFIPLSFYKIFGFPTGLGCLLAKRSAYQQLHPSGIKSGSVCSIPAPWTPRDDVLRYEDSRRFEHGTPNYMAFEATTHGLQFVQSIGIDVIGQRSRALARWLESCLSDLRHENGSSLVRIYESKKNNNNKGEKPMKGATIMFNFFDRNKLVFPFEKVNSLLADCGISLRTGCFCNMGVVQQATIADNGPERLEVERRCQTISSCSQFQSEILAVGFCGAMRISFGLGSTFNDAFAFYLVARGLLNCCVSDLDVV